MQMWNYNARIEDVFEPMTKKSKIKIVLQIFQCHNGSCFQMQTLAFMYMISE
jgi:hypothetical protein